MLTIQLITEESPELNAIRLLFREYAAELNENLCFQRFDEELFNPLKKYGEPNGCLLLAHWNQEPVACIALQPITGNEACEMKRLYVKPPFRKLGIAEELVIKVLKLANEKGYEKMVLDTLKRLQPAVRLYKKFGFKNTTAYYVNPLPGVIYMERQIKE